MAGEQKGKASGALAVVIAVVVLPIFVVGVAILEEVFLGSTYVSSLYRRPIDSLIDTVAGLF